jgi:hypothetical protein
MSLTERRVGLKAALAAGLLGLLALLLLAIGPPPAEAHDTCSQVVPDGSVACLRFNHTKIDVCDRQADGHKAYARSLVGYDAAGQPAYYRWYDNDPGNGCSRYNFPKDFAQYYIACVQFEGCGRPYYKPGYGSPTW